MFRSQWITSEAESVASEQATGKEDREKEVPLMLASMFPPSSIDKLSSCRSSFSGSNAPRSPVPYSCYGCSPSPMPPLPATRAPLPTASPGAAWHASVGVKSYGDESYTNFLGGWHLVLMAPPVLGCGCEAVDLAVFLDL